MHIDTSYMYNDLHLNLQVCIMISQYPLFEFRLITLILTLLST